MAEGGGGGAGPGEFLSHCEDGERNYEVSEGSSTRCDASSKVATSSF